MMCCGRSTWERECIERLRTHASLVDLDVRSGKARDATTGCLSKREHGKTRIGSRFRNRPTSDERMRRGIGPFG